MPEDAALLNKLHDDSLAMRLVLRAVLGILVVRGALKETDLEIIREQTIGRADALAESSDSFMQVSAARIAKSIEALFANLSAAP